MPFDDVARALLSPVGRDEGRFWTVGLPGRKGILDGLRVSMGEGRGVFLVDGRLPGFSVEGSRHEVPAWRLHYLLARQLPELPFSVLDQKGEVPLVVYQQSVTAVVTPRRDYPLHPLLGSRRGNPGLDSEA